MLLLDNSAPPFATWRIVKDKARRPIGQYEVTEPSRFDTLAPRETLSGIFRNGMVQIN